jgi:hypothetical protein
MQTFAVVINGVVDNVIQYDGGWSEIPTSWELIQVNQFEIVQLGWIYDPASTPRFYAPETLP